jgi:hypothetical protein
MRPRWTHWAASSLLVALAGATSTPAHETRPGLLALREEQEGGYQVTWTQPAAGDLSLRIWPIFPAGSIVGADPGARLGSGVAVTRFHLRVPGGLDGRVITIGGLEDTYTDALVRLERADGTVETQWAHSSGPTVTVGLSHAAWDGLRSSAALGWRHIVFGPDHLLFLLGLLLTVRGGRALLLSITAFSVGHSVSLAVATAGWAKVPSGPVNVAIAASIMIVAAGALRTPRPAGRNGTTASPWRMTFCFGLLHGLGFASGLAADGLTGSEVARALIGFNAGVEAGQLAFLGGLIVLEWAFAVLQFEWPKPVARLPAYFAGSCGACWAIARCVAWLSIPA